MGDELDVEEGTVVEDGDGGDGRRGEMGPYGSLPVNVQHGHYLDNAHEEAKGDGDQEDECRKSGEKPLPKVGQEIHHSPPLHAKGDLDGDEEEDGDDLSGDAGVNLTWADGGVVEGPE